jgi:hypothetical protein
MEASIPVLSRPLADSPERQIWDTLIVEDGRDHTGKEPVGDPLRKSGADIIALTEPESTRSVSPFSWQTQRHCSPADINVSLAVSIR